MAYEKMPCLYDTEKDLLDRLGGTICRYKGRPVKVEVESKRSLNLYTISDGKFVGQISPNDPEFDISSMEVGYVNFFLEEKFHRHYIDRSARGDLKTVVYLKRGPYRKYRQGINSDCTSLYSIDGSVMGQSICQYVLYSKGMEDAQTGVFPSVSQAVSSMHNREVDKVAISQEVAFERIPSGLFLVYYRGKNIAWITPDRHTIEFPDSESSWLYRRLLKRFL